MVLSLLGNWENDIYWFDFFNKNKWSFVYPGIPSLLVSFSSDDRQINVPASIDFSTVTTYRSNMLYDLNVSVEAVEKGLKELKRSIVLGKMIYIEEGYPLTMFDQNIEEWKSRSNQGIDLIIMYIKKRNMQKLLKK